MGVYKRGKKYWIRYSIAGRQYREPVNTTHKRMAENALAKRLTEIAEGQWFPDKKKRELTVAGMRDLWLAHAADKSSLQDDRQRLRVIVDFFGPTTQIAALDLSDVDELKKALRSGELTGRKLRPGTVNRYLTVLRSALRHIEDQYRHRIPTGKIKPLVERNERDRVCTAEEYETLIGTASPELRLAIVIAYHTAMRLSEIANLRRDQIDQVGKVFRLGAKDTKTGLPRQVPMHREVAQSLADWPRRIDGRLFGTAANTLSQAFRNLCKAQRIENLHYHDLRHSALTNFRRAGMDIFTMKRISGHKTLKMLERYNTITEEDLREAISKLEDRR